MTLSENYPLTGTGKPGTVAPVEPDNTKPEVITRDRGRWVPGVSGNPGGQPKGMAELRAAARSHTMAAIDTLAQGLTATKLYGKDGTEHPDWSARNFAATALLDRGWGRPSTPVELAGASGQPLTGPTVDLTKLSPDEFARFRELCLKAKAEGGE